MANNYLDRDNIKLAIPDVSWGATYDAVMDRIAEEASREIDRYLGKKPGAFAAEAAAARYFTGSGTGELWVPEMAEAPTEVAVAEAGDLTDYTTWAATDYLLWPYNAPENDEPYTKLEIDVLNGTKQLWFNYPKSVKITARWGYSLDPPADVEHACIIQAIRSFKRAQQAYQDTGAVLDVGQLQYVKGLDPEVQTFLENSGLREVAI
jgi:hypothetical protein